MFTWEWSKRKYIFLNSSFSCKQVKVSWLARLGRNFDDYPGYQLFFTLGKHFAPKCTCIYHNPAIWLYHGAKWTLLERFLTKLLTSLLKKSIIDNIFIERLGLRPQRSILSHISLRTSWLWFELVINLQVNIYNCIVMILELDMDMRIKYWK